MPVKSHGQRSLAGHSPWGHKELDMTERLNTHIQTLQTDCRPSQKARVAIEETDSRDRVWIISEGKRP